MAHFIDTNLQLAAETCEFVDVPRRSVNYSTSTYQFVAIHTADIIRVKSRIGPCVPPNVRYSAVYTCLSMQGEVIDPTHTVHLFIVNPEGSISITRNHLKRNV